jgi:hypothetical protein
MSLHGGSPCSITNPTVSAPRNHRISPFSRRSCRVGDATGGG